MSKTFYIETDEEIISVIGRLRKSSAEENVFVFPKRALVLQSIINLRLLQREAQKLGKKIIVVSQDETGRMLAEKAGIETENYSEDFSRQDAHLELASSQVIAQPPAPGIRPVPQQEMLRSDSIGSVDFHVAAVPVAPSQGPTTLRIRNATPEKLTSLNSKRFEEAPSSVGRTEVFSQAAGYAPLAQSEQASLSPSVPERREMPRSDRGERLKNFYSGTRSETQDVPMPKKSPERKAVPITGKKAHTIFLILGGISVLSFAGVLAFLFLPKAEVHATPYKIAQNVDVELAGRAEISSSDENAIVVRIVEKEKEASLTVTATGKSGGVNQKARGTVIIYNNYSTDPQPLVATTRLETEDGKLFRLVSGVTVPGMTDKNGAKDPGIIEADVVADQSGEEYNIGPSTFRIPGFKGSPKYEAFSAKSTKTMVGGGNAGASDVAVVAKVDLDTAEREAREKAKEDFLTEVRSGLGPDEKILDEQMDISATAPAAVPQIGTVATAFEYKNTFKFRAFVFSERTVREKVEATSEKELQGMRFKPISEVVTYDESLPNFSEGTLRLRVHASVTMESDIDRDALRKALLGQNEDAIQETLGNFPEVKKIAVTFRPQLFVRSIPDSEDRVVIIVEPGEEGE